jgi:hypothetical protein
MAKSPALPGRLPMKYVTRKEKHQYYHELQICYSTRTRA